MSRKNRIPRIDEVDVVVIGGATGGVAAACAAARVGARVLLACPETYLGEDICSTGRLWLPPSESLDHALAVNLFAEPDGTRKAPVRPMDVKRILDTALHDAGVTLLFGCAPTDILCNTDGNLGGVILTGRSGPFAVAARALIDATPLAVAARAAAVPFTTWSGGTLAFERVVIGARAEHDNGRAGKIMPGSVVGFSDGRPDEQEAFLYRSDLPVDHWRVDTLAEAEQAMIDRTWHRDQIWSSDRCAVVPPVAVDTGGEPMAGDPRTLPPETFATPRPGIYVLGACAAVTRETAAQLQWAPAAIAAGDRLGVHVAQRTQQYAAVRKTMRPLHSDCSVKGFSEPCTITRFMHQPNGWINGPAGAGLPLLADVDVVVVGGGTGGAPAAIAAVRNGARVLLIESLYGLGGVGTLGCISRYYHGYRYGFTAEVTQGLKALSGEDPFMPDRWNPRHKSEWFRRELRHAGGAIWFGSLVSGVIVRDRHVRGVVVNTPAGRGWVQAATVIDASGNADVAAAAGVTCRIVSEDDLAIQGSGLPPLPFRPTYCNTDYTFIDDGDPVDITRAFVTARRKFAAEFDLAALADTRERRQIVGDITVTACDVHTGRTWRDTICLSRSNFDSHGFTVDPLFLALPPDRTSLDAELPLRALLPRGLEGLLATGLSISAQRDVMPVLRMQADIQNHAYAAGLAAALACCGNGDGCLRRIDVRDLQRRLVDYDILPQTFLLHGDRPHVSLTAVKSAAAGSLRHHAELAALLSRPDDAPARLRKRFEMENDMVSRRTCAILLALLDDRTGESMLCDIVAQSDWDDGWNYTGMGQFGRSLSPLDDVIVTLARLRSERARVAVLEKAAILDVNHAFSHFRAVALYAESVGGEDWARRLAGLLELPGVSGHAWTNMQDALENIPQSATDTTTRNVSLRELYLARALVRCGDCNGLGRRLIETYARDIRGHYARHAAAVLRKP